MRKESWDEIPPYSGESRKSVPLSPECVSTPESRLREEKEAVCQKQAADREQKRRAREFGRLVTLMAVVAVTAFVLLAFPGQAKTVLSALWPVALPVAVFLLVTKWVIYALEQGTKWNRPGSIIMGGLVGLVAMSAVCIAIISAKKGG
jgi:uncharacterized membrane protein (DUF485 family)